LLHPLYPPSLTEEWSIQYFQDSELGKLHASLPLDALVSLLPKQKKKRGGQPKLSNKGRIALQFLKPYLGLSDEKLRERINTDWALKRFLDLPIQALIKDKDLIWKTRKYVATHLSINKWHSVLINYWQPWMKDTHVGLSDATCYESYIKYPTDQKLLWDCCEWLQSQIIRLSKHLRKAKPRNKYLDQQRKQKSFAKQKKKTYKQKRRRTRVLLYLCNKQLFQLEELVKDCVEQHLQWSSVSVIEEQVIDDFFHTRFQVIGKIYEQQRYMYEQRVNKVPNRIVSLFKPYLRPIVRGKENKRVEFGVKLNSWQVDGINFIEHYSFSAFHEGNRLIDGIIFHHQHFGKLRSVGADAIYATNKNRKFTKRFHIHTCFPPKGRRKSDDLTRKQEDQARSVIAKARSTILEGTYGNDKNHYGLRKIKARSEITEISWIFFGMMCANAVKIAKRKAKDQLKQRA